MTASPRCDARSPSRLGIVTGTGDNRTFATLPRCRDGKRRCEVVRAFAKLKEANPREVVMRVILKSSLAVVAALLAAALPARAEKFTAQLSGFNEIGALGAGETGAILTPGTGTLDLDLNEKTQTVTYSLTFSALTTPVTQAHIHFGKARVAGGIFAFLCTNLGNGPVGTPACPAAGGTVSGTITPASVVAVPGQNIAAGDFTAVVDAITSRTAYANVHTVKFPAGEIRGQIHRPREPQNHDHDHDKDDHQH
jgi:hypothetical protein